MFMMRTVRQSWTDSFTHGRFWHLVASRDPIDIEASRNFVSFLLIKLPIYNCVSLKHLICFIDEMYLRLMVALSTLAGFVRSSCLTGNYVNYPGHDLNDGTIDKAADMRACRTHCAANYPSAKYFTYIRPSAPHNPKGCWCKNAKSDRRNDPKMVSGEICRGKQ